MLSKHLFPLLLLPSSALATLVATYPGGDNVVFKTGDDCLIKYNLCKDGTYNSVEIDLATGENLQMVNVTRVASGIDTTKGDGTYTYKCPDVTPNSNIYFYQFLQDGQPTIYTSRFTIAAADGSTTDPEHATQPDGSPVPWGIGKLASPDSAEANTTETSTSTDLPTSTTSAPGPQPTSTDDKPAPSGDNSTIAFIEAGACTADSQCPEESPCCSEWGFCGTGRSCLAGCNPFASFKPSACAPIPACLDVDLSFGNTDRIIDGATWNGDGETADWIVDTSGMKTGEISQGDELLLTLTQENGGTTVSSTHSVLYGEVVARIKTQNASGIVTEFKLVSGTEDSIDWQFRSNADSLATTSYSHRGSIDAASASNRTDTGPPSGNVTISANVTDPALDYHDYSINWTPDSITWSVDGVPVRNVTKDSTLDASKKAHIYPQSPSRIQFLIYAAQTSGQESDAATIDWTNEDYAKFGYFASLVESVSVKCYDPTLLDSASTATATTESSGTATSLSASSSPISSSADNTTATPPATSSTDTSIYGATSPTSAPAVTVTLWWTGEGPPPAGVTAPARKKRTFIDFLKRRADTVSAYLWGDVDPTTGELSVNIQDAATVIDSNLMSGLDLTETSSTNHDNHSTDPTATDDASTGTNSRSHSGSATASAPSSSSSAPTAQEAWDSLGSGAQIGIYIVGAIVGILIVVLVGWMWRKLGAARRLKQAESKGTYAPLQDGGLVPGGPIYSGTGEIHPGEDLYAGGQAPPIVPPVVPLQRKPTFVGGFVSSAQLRASQMLKPKKSSTTKPTVAPPMSEVSSDASSFASYAPPVDLQAQYGASYTPVASRLTGQPRY